MILIVVYNYVGNNIIGWLSIVKRTLFFFLLLESKATLNETNDNHC
jgi:hypothetical protein